MLKNLIHQNKLLIHLYQSQQNKLIKSQLLNINLLTSSIINKSSKLSLIHNRSYHFATYNNNKKSINNNKKTINNYQSQFLNNGKSSSKYANNYTNNNYSNQNANDNYSNKNINNYNNNTTKQSYKIRPSKKQLKKQQQQKQRQFYTSPIDSQLFIQHINNKNTLNDAVKLMNKILNTRTLNKNQFEQTVWKKYSYYIHLIGQKQQSMWSTQTANYSDLNKINQLQNNSPNLKNNSNQQNLKQTQLNSQQLHQQQEQINNQSNQINQKPIERLHVGNHELARKNKYKKLRIQFLSQITQLHQRFKGQLHSQNVIKTFNKFIDFYFQKQQWKTLIFSQKVSLLQSLSRYNIKKAKTLFLKKRENLFIESNMNIVGHKQIYHGQDLINVLLLMSKLQINDTRFFQKCIDYLYDQVNLMKLDKLEQLTFILGKSHKFVNKDFLLKLRNRFNQLINQFNDSQVIKALHIISSFSMIQKNMRLTSIYFEPLDLVYERIFPIFNLSLLSRLKSKYISTVASALRRSQYFDDSVLNAIISQCIKRDVLQFSLQQGNNNSIHSNNNNTYSINKYSSKSYNNKQLISTINIQQLTQVFFALASFNYRNAQFMKYFINLLTVIQSSNNPQQYISYPLFSKLLWSICVLCNQQQINKLLPLMQHFYKKSQQIQPHQATNFYYCYLLMKMKYLVSQIRFENDKVQQYLSGPKHQIQISSTQKQIHSKLLEIGIPSLLQYNLNNVICDIYIPKYLDIQHLIIQVHGFHHFCRNIKRLNGSTVLKQKIIENQGYSCFYIALDQWLIAQNKTQFIKQFFQTIVTKKHQQKVKKKILSQSLKTVQRVEKRGRRILQFKPSGKATKQKQIQQKQEQAPRLTNKQHLNQKQ